MFNKKRIEELEKRVEELENIIKGQDEKEEEPKYFNNNKGV